MNDWLRLEVELESYCSLFGKNFFAFLLPTLQIWMVWIFGRYASWKVVVFLSVSMSLIYFFFTLYFFWFSVVCEGGFLTALLGMSLVTIQRSPTPSGRTSADQTVSYLPLLMYSSVCIIFWNEFRFTFCFYLKKYDCCGLCERFYFETSTFPLENFWIFSLLPGWFEIFLVYEINLVLLSCTKRFSEIKFAQVCYPDRCLNFSFDFLFALSFILFFSWRREERNEREAAAVVSDQFWFCAEW